MTPSTTLLPRGFRASAVHADTLDHDLVPLVARDARVPLTRPAEEVREVLRAPAAPSGHGCGCGGGGCGGGGAAADDAASPIQ